MKSAYIVLFFIFLLIILLFEIIYETPICHSRSIIESKSKKLFIAQYEIAIQSEDSLDMYIIPREIFMEYACISKGMFGRFRRNLNDTRFLLFYDQIRDNYGDEWTLSLEDKYKLAIVSRVYYLDYTFRNSIKTTDTLKLTINKRIQNNPYIDKPINEYILIRVPEQESNDN